jgi:ACS family hexuronate transporter-like MFS transporter
MLIAKIVSHLLQRTHSYAVPFFLAGSAYLIALAAIHCLTPRLKPVVFNAAEV